MDHKKLKIQQEVQTQILVDLDTFCRQHNISYFMGYGTLLGAVRHKGFIPWDYDVDTFMTRSEHEKFMKFKHLFPKGMNVMHICYSDIDHAGLTRIWKHDERIGGVQIDIFILDYEKKNWPINLCRVLHFAKLSKNEKSILIKHFKHQPIKKLCVHLSKVVKLLLGGSANIERLI